MQVELFEATTQKKEASANLRMVSFLEKEVKSCMHQLSQTPSYAGLYAG